MALADYHLVTLFNKQANFDPKATALENYGMQGRWQKLTWRQLKEQTNQLARVFVDLGIRFYDRVVIWAPNCAQWTCVDYAIMKTKAVSVPIPYTCDDMQLRSIINDTRPKFVVVYNKEQYNKIAELQQFLPTLKNIIVIQQIGKLSDKSHYFLDDVLRADFSVSSESQNYLKLARKTRNLSDIFSIIYTSGTTGTMKGVTLDYKNIAYSIRQHDMILKFYANEVSLAFLPLSHIFERIWSLYVLSRGGKNVYLSDPQKIMEALPKVKPHVICVVPQFLNRIYGQVYEKTNQGSSAIFKWGMSVGNRVVDNQQAGRLNDPIDLIKHKFASKVVFASLHKALGGRIKFMPCAGALPIAVERLFQAAKLPVLSGYGTTETTATSTCNTLKHQQLTTCGSSLPTIEVQIAENGEILVRGETVMRGYYRRPNDTEKAFKDGWFCTGDTGYFDGKGKLVVVDRLQDMIRLSGGHEVSPLTVETTLTSNAYVAQAMVVGHGREFSAALIVPNMEQVQAWADKNKVAYRAPEDVLNQAEFKDFMTIQLYKTQAYLKKHQRIKAFKLLTQPFTVEAGLLTPTFKLKRRALAKKYATEIHEMYRDAKPLQQQA